jgi:hypothetical protein
VAGRAAAEANWISRPTTLREAAEQADAGGVVTVEAVQPGAPIVAAEDEVNPTVMVTMRVRDLWFGGLASTFTMKWLGTPGQGHMEGDPPYVVGQDYVIMLKKRGDGPWYRPESPDGRIQIHQDRARPVIEGPIADTVKGWGLGKLKQAL